MSLLLLVLTAYAPIVSARINVVLVGATGNLAKKYLFQAFYDQIQDETYGNITLIPAATKAYDAGEAKVSEAIKEISCPHLHDKCQAQENKFRANTWPYQQLRSEEQWEKLGREITAHHVESGEKETGRLVYLSIPPQYFGISSKYINQHLRPDNGAWLRVVFEKPFGRDLKSAEALADEISGHLKEEEILRVDHYLGKAGVQAIASFKQVNPDLTQYLDKEHVTHVEIGMHETEDCAGRTKFYDKYGVVRDVMQNHLTELAVLAAMDTDLAQASDHQAFKAAKTETLEALVPPQHDQTVVAQYAGYGVHVAQDIAGIVPKKAPEEPPQGDDATAIGHEGSQQDLSAGGAAPKTPKPEAPSAAQQEHVDPEPSIGHQDTKTPTYGFTTLFFDNDRWTGVPFFLSAGKALSERKAYVRFHFEGSDTLEFQIQGPMGTQISTTINDIDYVNLPGWEDEHEGGVQYFRLYEQKNAYWEVVDYALRGDYTLFVDTKDLLLSWEKWTPLLEAIDSGDAGQGVPLQTYYGAAETNKIQLHELEDLEVLLPKFFNYETFDIGYFYHMFYPDGMPEHEEL